MHGWSKHHRHHLAHKYEVKQEKQWEREDRAAGTEIRNCSDCDRFYVDCRERSEEVLGVGRNSGLGCWGDKGEGRSSCRCCEDGTQERQLRLLQWQPLKDMG